MAKTNAPLLSFGGSGKIGNTLVFSKWKGIPYVRQHVVPANPQTAAQMVIRRTFALLREMWKIAPSELLETWNAHAAGRPLTGMNKYVGENVRVLKNDVNMDDFIGSPGARGGLSPKSFEAQTGLASGEINTTFVAPDIPDGWTLTRSVAIAFKDQAPDGIFTGTIEQAVDETAPYAPVFTGLEPSAMYQVVGWLVWTKPNGDLAYSVGITDQAAAAA